MKNEHLDQVEEFHNLFEVPVLNTPQIPDQKRCELRISLISEELQELKDAIASNDLVEVADALCDLQYVLSGTVLEFGMKEKFSEMFAEVHRSNLSKACETLEIAELTAQKYEQNYSVSYGQVKDKYLVYRTDDEKVLKSVKYSPADLVPFLDAV